jgi:hypothetical protein
LKIFDILVRDARVKGLPAIGHTGRSTRDGVGKKHAFIDVLFQGRDDLVSDVDAPFIAVFVAGKAQAAAGEEHDAWRENAWKNHRGQLSVR